MKISKFAPLTFALAVSLLCVPTATVFAAEDMLTDADREEIKETVQTGVETQNRNKQYKEEEQRVYLELVHEAGKYSFGVDYSQLYAGEDFDPNIASNGSVDTKGAALYWNWFPLKHKWLGKLGVGIVGSFAFGKQNEKLVGDRSLYVLSAGPSVTYEMKILNNQIIVPFVMYGYSFTSANFKGSVLREDQIFEVDTEETFWESRFNFGGLLNLNIMEPSAARAMYQNLGIRKTNVAFSYGRSNRAGDNIFVGLRFEY